MIVWTWLYGSIRAYLYYNAAFLQSMMEASVALVFTSALAGLLVFSRSLLAASLCVYGG